MPKPPTRQTPTPRYSPSEKALSALMAWNMARHVLNGLRAARNGHRCEYEERGDLEVGDLGVAPCYRGAESDSWCDSCKTRDPLHAQMMEAKRSLVSLRGKLQRAADRAVPDLICRALNASRSKGKP